MDLNSYPTNYSDKSGTEVTVITNDGQTLRMCVRNVEFSGPSFDALKAPKDATSDQLSRFTLNAGDLCACRIECRMPIPISENGTMLEGILHVTQMLGNPTANGGIDAENQVITLEFKQQRFSGSGTSGWFEGELNEIQAQLPAGVFMKACINCAYSDYSPYGHGSFGNMMCFRNIKSEYLQVHSKDSFWSVHERCDGFVQETYLCPQFDRRKPGTGYRG